MSATNNKGGDKIVYILHLRMPGRKSPMHVGEDWNAPKTLIAVMLEPGLLVTVFSYSYLCIS